MNDRSSAFVVKLWEERRDVVGAAPTWRGSVDDVLKGGRTYFTTLIELCDYLSQRSGMAGRLVETADRRPRRRQRRSTTDRLAPSPGEA